MRKCVDGPGTPLRALLDFAEAEGFHVTSTCGGRHNAGSAHPRSLAIDVRTHDHRDAEVETMMRRAQAKGFIVRDERVRPPKQKRWSGPHVHLEHKEPSA